MNAQKKVMGQPDNYNRELESRAKVAEMTTDQCRRLLRESPRTWSRRRLVAAAAAAEKLLESSNGAGRSHSHVSKHSST
jgi:hypothetical protein